MNMRQHLLILGLVVLVAGCSTNGPLVTASKQTQSAINYLLGLHDKEQLPGDFKGTMHTEISTLDITYPLTRTFDLSPSDGSFTNVYIVTRDIRKCGLAVEKGMAHRFSWKCYKGMACQTALRHGSNDDAA